MLFRSIWMGGDPSNPSPAVLAASNSAFFQILGIASLVVGFLCYFFLKEPKGSFADAVPEPLALTGR